MSSAVAPTQANDLMFGIASQNTVQGRIASFLNTTLDPLDDYSVMDWANPGRTIYVELKTRRIRHDQYPTALIGLNKIEFCSDPQKEYYFCFAYTDGIYFIKYDAELFATFDRNYSYQRGDRPDCINHASRIVYIPVNLLQPFP
jgi:hypothetical protein